MKRQKECWCCATINSYTKKEITREERYRVANAKFEASLLQDAEDRKKIFKIYSNK